MELTVGAENRPLLDLVASLAVYVEPSGPDQYSLVFSKYVIGKLKSSGINATNMCGLLDFAQALPVGILDAGHALVLLTAQILAMRLALCKTLSDAPCLSRASLVSNTRVFQEVGGKFRLAYVASFGKGTAGRPVTLVGPDGLVTERSFDPQDWLAFVGCVFQKFPNTVALPMDNNSAGPDLLLPVSDASGRASCLLLFACKDRQNAGQSGWPEISDEVAKCLQRPRDCNVRLPLVLFFISTRLNSMVTAALKGDSVLVLGEGSWQQASTSGPVSLLRSGGLSDAVVVVPPGCQLVVLGEQALHSFYGANVLESLASCFNKEDGVTTERLNVLLGFHQSMFMMCNSRGALFAFAFCPVALTCRLFSLDGEEAYQPWPRCPDGR